MDEYQTVARVDDIPERGSQSFAVNGRMVAVFRQGETFYAVQDACPHMGASLVGGELDDTAVMCPWHAWRFCVKEGTWLDNPRSKLRLERYPVRVQNGEIQVAVPATLPE